MNLIIMIISLSIICYLINKKLKERYAETKYFKKGNLYFYKLPVILSKYGKMKEVKIEECPASSYEFLLSSGLGVSLIEKKPLIFSRQKIEITEEYCKLQIKGITGKVKYNDETKRVLKPFFESLAKELEEIRLEVLDKIKKEKIEWK